MRRLVMITALVALFGGGCVDIPGQAPGDRCNTKGICAQGLLCEDDVCVDEGDISWVQMVPPSLPTLYDVWGSGPEDLYAVGASGKVLRYKGGGGTVWSSDTTQTISSSTLYAIWGHGPNQIWAVGSNIVLFKGSTGWVKQTVRDTKGAELQTFTLYDIHSDGSNVWAVGRSSSSDPLVLRHDANEWKQVEDPTSNMFAFVGKGVFVHQGSVWIVGNAAHVLHLNQTTGWSHQVLDAQNRALSAIWGVDANNIVAVGPSKILARYNGKAWTVETEARGSGAAHSVWGPGDGAYYVVGAISGGYSDLRSGVERCTNACSVHPVPEVVRSKLLRGVWGTPDGKAVYAVGSDGVILRRSQ